MTPSKRHRYARQISLSEIGENGQQRLAESSVVVIGAGGLGSPVLHHLVASGIGRVGIVEFDSVDVSNLHRQTLYSTPDVGRPKIEAAEDRLRAVNSEVDLVLHDERFMAESSDAILAPYDLVIDGSDTFATRYAANDAAVRAGIPLIYASVNQFSGQASVFGATNGPCYRCLFPEPPPDGLIPSCADGGVLGVVPSIMGTIQATEALKLLLGIGDTLVGRLLMFDALAMEFRELQIDRDPGCPTCGDHRRRIVATETPEITVPELRAQLAAADGPPLLDVREVSERQEFDIGGRLIPLGMLDIRAFELDDVRHQPLVVYCASGGRSAQAVRMLRERGFDARSLRGGMQAWRASESQP